MKTLLLIALTISPLIVLSQTSDDDFWNNCPGPACPANSPDLSEARMERTSEHEIMARERELLNREKDLLERERMVNEREMQL